MLQELTLAQWRILKDRGELVTVDVRSPSEFHSATIPGSVNIPIFDDEERAEVGTLYAQVSVEAAKERGLELVSAKLPRFIKEFSALPGKKAVFCWRGGMRSKTTATLLSLMGMSAYRLSGGYRAYRQWVVQQLQQMEYRPRLVVLHGNTGSGKTEILRRLQAKGFPVIDLEAMAGHRGSVFGDIGMQAHNQKMFDALLYEQMWSTREQAVVVLEAESRRIGKIVLPDLLVKQREEGLPLSIELPIQARVQQILKDYQPWEHPNECHKAFQLIRSRIHTPVAREIQDGLDKGEYEHVVELLLLSYYDPKYTHASLQSGKEPHCTIQAQTVEEAFQQTEQFLEKAIIQQRKERKKG
ncbi:tRNA 2-selenouridine(34) synthase MnmH [Gorillibacterium sp. CAU 1737]|uniref:tRNA 2-selenouridine(34) synthase MnmH n=1 Tax=Gorillibacterium sp. CAU 1737 TaxID=3140362 RepID=UPI00325FF578